MAFEGVARTDVGCRRKLNEDAVLCRSDLGVWAIADGMGGHQRGEVASALIVSLLEQARPASDMAARILNLRLELNEANAQLVQMARETPGSGAIGATAVVLAIEGGRFACLWAGDSRAYQLRASGLVQLTRDHSLVQHLVDAGELDPAEADAHPNAHIVTRAVGADPNLALDVVEGEIFDGDAFLLASDGLTRVVTDQEILDGLRRADIAQAADDLLGLALARGAPDNVSLILVRASA
jgi:serine/threonine-protein phosphatase Stp1